jgi:hypothetical protein
MDTTGRLESARELATATEWLAVLAARQERGLVVWAAQAADQRRRRAGGVSDTQHSPDIASGHVPASVLTGVRHHEASQAGAKLSGTVGLRLRDRAATRRIIEVSKQQAETAALHVGPDIGSPLRT